MKNYARVTEQGDAYLDLSDLTGSRRHAAPGGLIATFHASLSQLGEAVGVRCFWFRREAACESPILVALEHPKVLAWAERYTRAANQKKLAGSVVALINAKG